MPAGKTRDQKDCIKVSEWSQWDRDIYKKNFEQTSVKIDAKSLKY